MAELNRRRFALLLALTPGIGGRTLTRVLARMDLLDQSPVDWLALAPEALQESYGLKPKQIKAILDRSDCWLDEADGLELKLAQKNVQLVTAADAHYPERLEEFDPDPPSALFCYGNMKLLQSRTFAVMSSRNTTFRGLEIIEKLAEEGVFNAETLVTGHDKPEYQRSAIVPLRWGSPRILIFDRGIFLVLGEDLSQEPFRAARLWRYQFDPKTDLAISPFKPDGPFKGVHNQIRDRLVAAMSDRIDFVEVAPNGNMEKLARMALKAQRPVRISDRADIVYQLREAGASVLEAS